MLLANSNIYANSYISKINSINYNSGIQVIESPKIEEPIINSFGMILQNSISGRFPTYYDSSSNGSAKVIFNMGQKAFKGNRNGYQPYDTHYSSDLIIGKAGGDNETGFYTSNLSQMYYNKTYYSGKYYFEIELNGTPHADLILISNLGNKNSQDGLAHIGSYFGNTSYPWELSKKWTSNSFISGDTIQVFLDYDQNRMLMQKLNTTIDDYQNYVTY